MSTLSPIKFKQAWKATGKNKINRGNNEIDKKDFEVKEKFLKWGKIEIFLPPEMVSILSFYFSSLVNTIYGFLYSCLFNSKHYYFLFFILYNFYKKSIFIYYINRIIWIKKSDPSSQFLCEEVLKKQTKYESISK